MTTSEQQALFDALAAHLERETMVEALWLAGSLGAGGGDAYSDIDLLALAADGRAGDLSTRLAADCIAAFDAVLVNPLYGGRVLNVVAAAWQRFDLTIVEREHLERYDANALTPVFNRGESAPSAKPASVYRTPPDKLIALVNEFLRVLGLAPVGIGRAEWQITLSGLDLLRRMTFDLMLEENSIDPAKRGGALHPSRFLTDAQKAAFASLPTMAAEPTSLMAGQAAFARLFLPRARALADQIGAPWPQAFEDATRRHLRAALGLEI
jgi:hypothetical protein